MPTLQARCINLAGSQSGGLLLMRIAYWQEKTKYTRGGHRWAVQSSEKWQAEVPLTRTAYFAQLGRLTKADLVVVERHLFGNKVRSWIRLTDRATRLLSQPYGTTDSPKSGTTDSPANGTTDSPANGTINNKGVRRTELDKKIEESSRINPLAKNVSGFEKDSEEDQQCETNEKNACASAPENEEAMSKHEKSVYDVVAARKAKMLLHKPDNAKALGNLWLTLFAEHHGPTVKNLNTKQLKQLKDFILAMPEGKASEILERVITEWKEFTSHSKDEAGAFGIPSKPTLDFLLKYVGCAVSFASSPNHQQEAQVFVSKKVEPLQSIALWKKPSLAHPDTGSLEEALAIFNDDTDVN